MLHEKAQPDLGTFFGQPFFTYNSIISCHFQLVYEQRVDDQFHKYLARFDLQLQMLSKCEAPKYIQERVVTSCRVCHVEETDCIYLAVNTPNDCYLYELTPDCKWTEVYTMRGRNVADICKLATVGK